MPSWTLENADETAAAHRYTFFKSPRGTIALVKPGDSVRLIFLCNSDEPDAPRAERMWVHVDKVEPDGRFIGRLNNQPCWIKDLHPDDIIEFDASHIINTEFDDDDNLVERYIKRCYVSNRILKEGAKVGYLYREAPDNDQDSGWCLMANDETQEYMDDAKNLSFVSLGLVLSKHDSFIDLLDAPEGAAFVWNAPTGEWLSDDVSDA